MKMFFSSVSIHGHRIATNLYTIELHVKIFVMITSESVPGNKIKFYQIWIMMEKFLMKWTPTQHLPSENSHQS